MSTLNELFLIDTKTIYNQIIFLKQQEVNYYKIFMESDIVSDWGVYTREFDYTVVWKMIGLTMLQCTLHKFIDRGNNDTNPDNTVEAAYAVTATWQHVEISSVFYILIIGAFLLCKQTVIFIVSHSLSYTVLPAILLNLLRVMLPVLFKMLARLFCYNQGRCMLIGKVCLLSIISKIKLQFNNYMSDCTEDVGSNSVLTKKEIKVMKKALKYRKLNGYKGGALTKEELYLKSGCTDSSLCKSVCKKFVEIETKLKKPTTGNFSAFVFIVQSNAVNLLGGALLKILGFTVAYFGWSLAISAMGITPLFFGGPIGAWERWNDIRTIAQGMWSGRIPVVLKWPKIPRFIIDPQYIPGKISQWDINHLQHHNGSRPYKRPRISYRYMGVLRAIPEEVTEPSRFFGWIRWRYATIVIAPLSIYTGCCIYNIGQNLEFILVSL